MATDFTQAKIVEVNAFLYEDLYNKLKKNFKLTRDHEFGVPINELQIKLGDRLITIDGKDVRDHSLKQISGIISQKICGKDWISFGFIKERFYDANLHQYPLKVIYFQKND